MATPSPSPNSFASIAFAGDSWLVAAVVFAVLSVLILVLSYRSSPLRGGPRWIALLLKATGLIVLALVLLEPVRIEEEPKKNANDLVLVADNSAGLAIPLEKDQPAPSQRLVETLRTEDPARFPDWIEAIGDTFRLQTFLFDRTLRRSPDYRELDFERTDSNLGTALDGITTRFSRRPHAATVLLTDGNATDVEPLEQWIAEQESSLEANEGDTEKPAPVFPVVIGTDAPDARDLAIASVDATLTQFEDARVTVTVEVSARGEFPDPVEVFVSDEKGRELAAKELVFPPGEGTRVQPARLRLAAIPPGISFLTAAVRQTSSEALGELTERNNLRTLTVNQGSGPYRILYVSGRPNWEYKFLRRSLSQDAELEPVGLIRIAKREPKFEWRGRTGESSNPLFRGFDGDIPEETQKYDEPVLVRLNTSRPEELRDGFPSSAEELFPHYRAIVLDDIEAEFFTQDQQELIDRYIAQRGGTLLMLGGQESFQSGGWRNTAVGRMLPVYLESPRGDVPAVEATYNLTREGWLEPWMRHRAGQQDEINRLAYMPPFHAVNRIRAIKPGARLLATVADTEGRILPAVVTQRYGEGRTAAIPIGDLWRWGMKDAEQQDELAKSWRQIMRWAVNDVPSRVELEKEALLSGGIPLTRLSVWVRDEAFEPQDDATVVFTVTGRDGDSAVLTGEPSLEQPGRFTAEYSSLDSTGYRITATAVDGNGNEIGTAEAARAVNPEAREFATLGPDRAALERIANATGGEVLEIDELGRLPEILEKLELPVSEVRQRPLWHAPWMFLIALALFLGEWILRRRQGIL